VTGKREEGSPRPARDFERADKRAAIMENKESRFSRYEFRGWAGNVGGNMVPCRIRKGGREEGREEQCKTFTFGCIMIAVAELKMTGNYLSGGKKKKGREKRGLPRLHAPMHVLGIKTGEANEGRHKEKEKDRMWTCGSRFERDRGGAARSTASREGEVKMKGRAIVSRGGSYLRSAGGREKAGTFLLHIPTSAFEPNRRGKGKGGEVRGDVLFSASLPLDQGVNPKRWKNPFTSAPKGGGGGRKEKKKKQKREVGDKENNISLFPNGGCLLSPCMKKMSLGCRISSFLSLGEEEGLSPPSSIFKGWRGRGRQRSSQSFSLNACDGVSLSSTTGRGEEREKGKTAP